MSTNSVDHAIGKDNGNLFSRNYRLMASFASPLYTEKRQDLDVYTDNLIYRKQVHVLGLENEK